MEFLSNCLNVKSVPESYVYPPEKRPGNQTAPLHKAIPILNLADPNRPNLIGQVFKASQEFGFFQVINHGVSKDLLHDTMQIFKEFNGMSSDEKAAECSRDPKGSCRVYTSSSKYPYEEIHCWRDALTFNCHPLEEYVQFWPQKPTKFREVVGAYTVAVRKLGLEILELICEGLGLFKGYLGNELSNNPVLLVNYYPPCPEPSLTLGLPQHCDPSLITILLQDVNGLQVLKDGEWFGVEPLEDAFVVNIGYILQIVSNGKLKGAQHRVVTNATKSRQSLTYFVYPEDDAMVETARPFLNEDNPPRYRSFQFKEFQKNYLPLAADTEAVMSYISRNK